MVALVTTYVHLFLNFLDSHMPHLFLSPNFNCNTDPSFKILFLMHKKFID